MVNKKSFFGSIESVIESIPRWGYIVVGLVFFIMSMAISFLMFNSGAPKDVSLPSITSENAINDVSQQSQSSRHQPSLTPAPPNTSTLEAPETPAVPETPNNTVLSAIEKDNQKKANLNVIKQKNDSIEGELKATNGEMNYAKSQIEYQRSQLKIYQKNRDRDLHNAEKYDDAAAFQDAEQMNKNIQEANKRINHLKDVISADQKKITELKNQKKELIQEKE